MSFRAVYRLYSLPLFALTSVLAADPSWVSNSANAGIFTSMAFDAERGKMVVFAETAYDGSLGGTWTWDRSHWTLEHPVHSPSSRDGAAMAYDPVRKEVVLFGGYGTNGNYSDTWTWNGVDWTQRMPSASPSARSFSAMAFDADRQQIVLFGGGVKNSGTFLDSFSDTWIWDGSNWSQKSPTASPSRRANHAMVYSSSQHKILLYGGGGYIGGGFGTPATDETWTWNGTNWTLENPAAKPGPRENFAMAWDPVRQIVVLWGQVWLGYNAETWIWDGTNWIRKTSAESPGARRWPAMAYDEVLQRVVLVGGENHMNLTEAWTWDGSTWGVTGVADPYDVYQNTLLYDTANQEILDLGLDRSNVYSRLWRWDGTTWSRQLLSNAPDRKDLAIFAFDSAHNEVLMVASTTSSFSANDETWSLKNGAWTKRSNAAPPGFRRRMVFDKARNEILLLSLPNGQPSASWNGSAWVSKPSTTVPTFTDFEMAYDDARQQVVAFGSGQTWIWDGSTWVNKTPAVSPSNRSGHAMAYDDQRQLVLLWGGLQAGVHVHDTWSWDGTAWTQFSTAISPPEIHPSMAFDSARKQLMLRGDNGANQTWFLDWGPLSNTFAYQVTSMPPGLYVYVDGQQILTPKSFYWLPGSMHTLDIADWQQGRGSPMMHIFQSWSDGSPWLTTILAPNSPATYTAQFTTKYRLQGTVSPPWGGYVATAPQGDDGYYSSGLNVQLTVTPRAGYTFTGFAGDLTGTASPQTLTLSAPRNFVANFAVTPGQWAAQVAPRVAFRDVSGNLRAITYGIAGTSFPGGSLASDPDLAVTATGDTVLVARDASGGIWMNRLPPGTQTWAGWRFLGGLAEGVPAVAITPDGAARIAIRDTWSGYWLGSFDTASGAGSWRSLGGIFQTDPVITATPAGTLFLVGKDQSNGLWTAKLDTPQSPVNWTFRGGIFNGTAAAVAGLNGILYTAALDRSGGIWFGSDEFGIFWWTSLGAISADTPRLAGSGDGKIYVAIRDRWDGPWYRSYDYPSRHWSSWTFPGGGLASMTCAAFSGELFITGQDGFGNFWWYRNGADRWSRTAWQPPTGRLAAVPH